MDPILLSPEVGKGAGLVTLSGGSAERLYERWVCADVTAVRGIAFVAAS